MPDTPRDFSFRSLPARLRRLVPARVVRRAAPRPRQERPLWQDPEARERVTVPQHLTPAAEARVIEQRHERTRREFLTLVCAGMGGAIGVMVAVPFVGALLAPLTRKTPSQWRSVGTVNGIGVGETKLVSFVDSSPLEWSGITANTAAWLRRTGPEQFQAFAINCTHLGCPVRWLQDAGLFMCPCHGGVFYSNGDVAAGPPEKPLFTYPVRIQNGDVQIQTSAVPIV
jgi:menaquinol-cytochrome c reductase iron-sulfur subunit